MGVASFVRNAIVEIEGIRYLLKRKVKETCWQLENTGDLTIKEHEERALYRLLINHKLKFVLGDGTSWGRVEKIELSEAEQELIRVRRAYVLAVVDVPITQKPMEAAIRKVWEKERKPDPKKPPAWITVYRWKLRYFAFGMDGNVLLDKNGGKRFREEIYGQTILDICEEAIDELYMSSEPGTIEDVLELAKQRVREEQLRIDEEQARNPESTHEEIVAPLKLPSGRLIKRLLADITEFDKYAARHGYQAATMKFRSVKGHDVTTEPFQEFQLDHTILDLFVLDDERGLPLGRPYLTVCIDNYTRCIMGIYIGFTPPSSLSVALCLKDAFLPKDFEEIYPEVKHEFPFGIPRRLKIDNGLEMHGSQLEQTCFSLGIIVKYCPRRKAWYKGKVERAIRTINDQVAHRLPGTTFSNIIQKGDYNPEKFAVVTLSTLRKGIRKWIADVYHQRPHRALHISPAQMWRTSIKPELVRVPHDPKVLDAIMGRPYPRRLTHKGIQFKNLQFNSAALRDLRENEGADLDVDVSVNEDDLGRIYVIWNNTTILEAKALNFEYADGLTAWQHEKFQEYQKEHNLPDDPDGWLQAKEAVRCIFQEEFAVGRRLKGAGRMLTSNEKSPAHEAAEPVPVTATSDDGTQRTSSRPVDGTTTPRSHFGADLLENVS